MKWLTTLDSMHIDNNTEPFNLYEGLVSFDGRVTLTHQGVFGGGDLQTLGSEAISNAFNFKDEGFTAKHAEINSRASMADDIGASEADSNGASFRRTVV